MTEYADRTKLPQFFFTGARLAAPRDELRRLAAEAARSTLPGAAVFDGVSPDGWAGALRLLASALPDGPAIIVFDEFPWLCETSPDLEGALQVAWDRLFESRQVLFILIGSDISMMEALSGYERPLFGRVKEMVVDNLTPTLALMHAPGKAELNAMVGEATIDAHDEEEQLMGFANLIEENVAMPFPGPDRIAPHREPNSERIRLPG